MRNVASNARASRIPERWRAEHGRLQFGPWSASDTMTVVDDESIDMT
jgi:hypothetical protein